MMCGIQSVWSLRCVVIIEVCGQNHGVEVCGHQGVWSLRYVLIKVCVVIIEACGQNQGVWSPRCVVIMVCGHHDVWS